MHHNLLVIDFDRNKWLLSDQLLKLLSLNCSYRVGFNEALFTHIYFTTSQTGGVRILQLKTKFAVISNRCSIMNCQLKNTK